MCLILSLNLPVCQSLLCEPTNTKRIVNWCLRGFVEAGVAVVSRPNASGESGAQAEATVRALASAEISLSGLIGT